MGKFTRSRKTEFGKLNQLYYLTKEIEMHERRLSEIDNIPYASENDKRELYEIINGMLQRCIRERDAIENYIVSIENDMLQQAFILRFGAALSWSAVACQVSSNINSNTLRMMAFRYLENHPLLGL